MCEHFVFERYLFSAALLLIDRDIAGIFCHATAVSLVPRKLPTRCVLATWMAVGTASNALFAEQAAMSMPHRRDSHYDAASIGLTRYRENRFDWRKHGSIFRPVDVHVSAFLPSYFPR